MSIQTATGINLTSGFKLLAEDLLDKRCSLPTEADRDELVTLHAAPVGLIVYVKSTKRTYQYNGNGEWEFFTKGAEYIHPTGDGNLHVPATGTNHNGQFLSAGATAGSIAWKTITPALIGASPAGHHHSNNTIDSVDASKVSSGILDLARIPNSALSRCVKVADDAARFALTKATVQTGDTVKVESTETMYYVVDDTKLNQDAGYEAYVAGKAKEVSWGDVTDVPDTMPNEYPLVVKFNNGTANGTDSFTYYGSKKVSINITPETIDAARTVHTHTKSQITDFPSTLKNPTSLSINVNGSNYSYDGSEAKSIIINPSTVGASPAGHTHSYLPLAGGTMTGQIKKAGVSSSWVDGRSNSMIRTTSAGSNQYIPIISAKSYNGSWELGTYVNNILHISYITDTNFTSGTNTQTADFQFRSDGVFGASSISEDGTLLSSKYAPLSHTHSYLPLSGGTISYNNTSGISFPLVIHQTGNANSSGWGPGIKFVNATDSNNKWSGIAGYASSTYSNSTGLKFYTNATNYISIIGNELLPTTSKNANLGNSNYYWNNIYGTTVYENGTSLSEKYAAFDHTHSDYVYDPHNLIDSSGYSVFIDGDVTLGTIFMENNGISYASLQPTGATNSMNMTVTLGNNIADGTEGATSGMIRMYGTSTGYVDYKPYNSGSTYTRYLVGTKLPAAVGSSSKPVYVSSTGTITACTVSTSPTSGSSNLITSGAVYSALNDKANIAYKTITFNSTSSVSTGFTAKAGAILFVNYTGNVVYVYHCASSTTGYPFTLADKSGGSLNKISFTINSNIIYITCSAASYTACLTYIYPN